MNLRFAICWVSSYLCVFLALPALQRSQRDTQRRNDFSELLTQITNYQSNNRGRLPTVTGTGVNPVESWEVFLGNYLRPTELCAKDPSSTNTGTALRGSDFKKVTNTGMTSNSCDPEMPETFVDPTGTAYYIGEVNPDIRESTNSPEGDYPLTWEDNKFEIYVYYAAKCNGENAIEADSNRNIAIRAKLEGGGIYCGNS